MFTGIITALGKITQAGERLQIHSPYTDLSLGESVAVNGVCLTVAEIKHSEFIAFLSPETLGLTNLGQLKKDDTVNLERALRLSDRLSGHLVQGHVDAVATVQAIEEIKTPQDFVWKMTIALPAQLTPYCVIKGSIAINGVSLTINKLSKTQLELLLIPHTWKHTQLSKLKPGELVNVETDLIGKYILGQQTAYKEVL